MQVTIGTRGSALALWQANHVKDRLLGDASLGVDDVRLEVISTRGDRIVDRPLSQVGGKGLFVKEIEDALLEGRVDLAVHSMKDVPSLLPEGLIIASVPEREDPRDAWVRPKGAAVAGEGPEALPLGAIVGTSSLRRASQLLAVRPDLRVVPIRGNVDTRLRKVDEGVDGLQATVLACAGLERLGWSDRITSRFEADAMLPAVGQGALGLEIREGDPRVAPLVAALHHPDTADAVAAERAFLVALEGDCRIPLACHGTIAADGDTLHVVGLVAAPDGRALVRHEVRGPRSDAAALGLEVAERVLADGGREILDALPPLGAGPNSAPVSSGTGGE